MQTYGSFRPTRFDIAGLGLHDKQDWLVLPVSRGRDSDHLAQSNYDVAIQSLERCDFKEWEEHSFNHWACGWYEIIIVKPGTTAEGVGREIEEALEEHPALDENDYSEREWEAHCEHVGQELQRVAYAYDGEVHDDADLGRLCQELGWSYHGRSPDDETMFFALCENGWFVPDDLEG